jgi:hypothetical protein
MIVAQSLNYCDEDKILPTFKKVFLEVIDKTDAWKADRSEHGTQA